MRGALAPCTACALLCPGLACFRSCATFAAQAERCRLTDCMAIKASGWSWKRTLRAARFASSVLVPPGGGFLPGARLGDLAGGLLGAGEGEAFEPLAPSSLSPSSSVPPRISTMRGMRSSRSRRFISRTLANPILLRSCSGSPSPNGFTVIAFPSMLLSGTRMAALASAFGSKFVTNSSMLGKI